MKKFVDLETGFMHFENGAVVKEGDTLEYVQSLNLGQESKVDIMSREARLANDHTQGYVWLRQGGIPFDGKFLSGNFLFINNSLILFRFRYTEYFPIPENQKVSNEVYYTKEYQMMRYEKYKIWFAKHVGEVAKYKWGGVFCGYSEGRGDPDASMCVSYEEKDRLVTKNN